MHSYLTWPLIYLSSLALPSLLGMMAVSWACHCHSDHSGHLGVLNDAAVTLRRPLSCTCAVPQDGREQRAGTNCGTNGHEMLPSAWAAGLTLVAPESGDTHTVCRAGTENKDMGDGASSPGPRRGERHSGGPGDLTMERFVKPFCAERVREQQQTGKHQSFCCVA